MRYFHVPLSQISDDRVQISGGELHHLTNVLRLREGDEVTVLDGVGGVYEVALVSCERDIAIGEIKERQKAQKPLVEVTLFVGLPKADKMDMIVQKATELGAHRIVPVACQRSVPRLSPERESRRVDRWRQISVGASKQSHRPFFPSISHFLSLDEALEECCADLRLIFTVGMRAHRNLKEVLRQNVDAKKVDIFIGPEGGFTEDEINRALSAGLEPVSLGSSILRTETAAIAALTIVLYENDYGYNNSIKEPNDV